MSLVKSRCAGLLRPLLPFLQRIRHGSSLYSVESLGVDRYVDVRGKVDGQFKSFAGSYRDKMKQYVEADSKNMIFTEDLKNMVHLCTRDDADLLEAMIRKYNSQKSELRFGNFMFGPIIMRMYYHLDLPDNALKMFSDPTTFEMFDQLSTHQIVLDLLYKHEKYDDMIKIYDLIEKNSTNVNKSKNAVILVMAACYKKNTKESFDYASALWSKLITTGQEPLRRAVSFIAALALKQNAAHIAMEVLSSIRAQKYITVINLKVAAAADLNRIDEALALLRSIVDENTVNVSFSFSEEVIEKVKSAVEKSGNKSSEREFQMIHKGLKNRNFIQSTTLDSLVCQTIQYSPKTPQFSNNSSARDQRYRSTSYQPRPGLQELV